MNDTTMTLVGNVCDEPTMRMTKSGHAVTNLRVASTARRYDRARESWVDCPTLFIDVTCWRALAENVVESVHKGQPVVVTGRYVAHTYEVGEQLRYALALEATAVGHDLARGTSAFHKSVRAGATSHVPADENGVPIDDSEHWAGLDSSRAGAGPASEHGDEPAELAAAS